MKTFWQHHPQDDHDESNNCNNNDDDINVNVDINKISMTVYGDVKYNSENKKSIKHASDSKFESGNKINFGDINSTISCNDDEINNRMNVNVQSNYKNYNYSCNKCDNSTRNCNQANSDSCRRRSLTNNTGENNDFEEQPSPSKRQRITTTKPTNVTNINTIFAVRNENKMNFETFDSSKLDKTSKNICESIFDNDKNAFKLLSIDAKENKIFEKTRRTLKQKHKQTSNESSKTNDECSIVINYNVFDNVNTNNFDAGAKNIARNKFD